MEQKHDSDIDGPLQAASDAPPHRECSLGQRLAMGGCTTHHKDSAAKIGNETMCESDAKQHCSLFGREKCTQRRRPMRIFVVRSSQGTAPFLIQAVSRILPPSPAVIRPLPAKGGRPTPNPRQNRQRAQTLSSCLRPSRVGLFPPIARLRPACFAPVSCAMLVCVAAPGLLARAGSY